MKLAYQSQIITSVDQNQIMKFIVSIRNIKTKDAKNLMAMHNLCRQKPELNYIYQRSKSLGSVKGQGWDH
jgi:hypothetical protein